MCQWLEYEYSQYIYPFAREIFNDCFEGEFPQSPIRVELRKECPSRTYINNDDYVSKKINALIKRGQLVTTEDVSNILRFNMRIAGEFIADDIPYIRIYFNQFDAKSMNEYISMVVNVLAHEFAHYLEYEYCKLKEKKHYRDARVSEAIADFFGVLFSLFRKKLIKQQFDLQIVENRYNTWKDRDGSNWPYAYALNFLAKPYKNKLLEYSDNEIKEACEKLRRVFKLTIAPDKALRILENL